MFEEIERLTRALCAEHGTSGCEGDVFKVAKKELGFCKEVCENELGGVVGIFGDLSSKRRILLDAHIDQIGMIVTDIDENGFLHVTNVGGVDRRTLPGSPVTVFGTETVTGIGCTLPPHLAKGEDKIKPVAEQCIDLGLPKEEVEKLVAVGDRAALTRPLKKLMGNRITGTALDDRAGCACVIRAAQLANEQNPDCCVMVLCSTKEEVGGQGAQVSAYALEPTEAIAVDVSFAKQPGRGEHAYRGARQRADDRLLRGAGQKNQQKACRARKARKYPVSAGSHGRQNGYELRRDQHHPRRRAHGAHLRAAAQHAHPGGDLRF